MTWNPFKKTTDEQPAEQNEPAASKESGAKITEGKGRPTPKRKEAQARNLRPLVPKDRKASAKAAKQRIRAKEDAEYEAMQNGDVICRSRSSCRGACISAIMWMPATIWASSSFR